jgi:hypothetical protein
MPSMHLYKSRNKIISRDGDEESVYFYPCRPNAIYEKGVQGMPG